VSQLEAPDPRRSTAIALAAVGVLAMAGSLAAGPEAAVAGAAVLIASCLLAMRELATPTFTWPTVLSAFVLMMWFIPGRGYRLPVTLPFNLEPYRLVLGLLVVVFLVAVANGRAQIRFGGYGPALATMVGAAVISAFLNYNAIATDAGDGAIKSLSYFLGIVAVFVLFSSVLRTHEEIDTVLRAFVIGAAVVGLSTVYESRFGYNAFDHLHEYVPALVREARTAFDVRAGNVRVHASAQHPIALAGALLLAFPFSLYLSQRATTIWRSRTWLVLGGACAIGASATISRTTVIMIVAMLVVALMLRARDLVRYWPVLLLTPVVIYFAVPGALGGIFYSFFPKRGLLGADLYSRQGESGSGRLADLEPGLRVWSESPLFGKGLGSEVTTASSGVADVAEGAEGAIIFFDNQYLGTLISIGAIGFAGVLWFVWGVVGSMFKGARRARDALGDLMSICAVGLAGFGAGMLVFDAFAFVQAAMFFFMVAALGLQARRLEREKTASAET